MSERMKVRRIETETGSHIEPQLDEGADELTALRWKFAVLEADTGIVVDVRPGGLSRKVLGQWVDVRGYYSTTWDNHASGGYYGELWSWANGMQAGYEAAKRREGK